MLPRMVILNRKEYQEKFDEALAYSLSGEHEKSLNLLLELKEKRWIKFELSKSIAQEYLALGQYKQAQMIIKQIKPIDEEQKGQLFELNVSLLSKLELTKLQMENGNQNHLQQQDLENEELNLDEKIFQETKELQQQKKKALYQQQQVDIWVIQALHQQGYYKSLKSIYQAKYDLDMSDIDNLIKKKIDRIQVTFCFENFKQTLNLIEICQENYDILLLKVLCYESIKQYKLALNTLERCFEINQTIYNMERIYDLQYLLGLKLIQIHANNDSNVLHDYLLCKDLVLLDFYLIRHYNWKEKDLKPQCIKRFKQKIFESKNTQMYLYNYLFLMEYSLSNSNPILQRICDFLIKHAPRYSAGYAHQYQLFIDQKQMDQTFSLEQPLVQCEDCTLKYLTLAKLYKEKNQFALAHQALVQAKQIDQYNEEIYQIESDLFRAQKMYQQAYLTIRELVKLEMENYHFFCLTIAPMIDKYEYYRVIDLLQLVDNDSQKFDELKLLFKLLSYKTDQEDKKIFTLIQSMEEQDKILFSGHYWLLKNQVAQAHKYYEQINEIYPKWFEWLDTTYFNQQFEVISKLKQVQSLKQHEIADVICQLGIRNYKPSLDKQLIIHQRYINTIGFILTSIVYYESLDENIQVINSKYDIEVPKIEHFKSIIMSIIERIYGKSYIPSEKYRSYIEIGLKQLQRLFISTEAFMNSLYEFSEKYKQEMIEQFMELDHEIVQKDEGIKQIYQIPFFADPISRYALVLAIKMIGYYTELMDYYKSIEQWLTTNMIKLNIEAYYQIIRK